MHRFSFRVKVGIVGSDGRQIEVEAAGESLVDCPSEQKKAEFQSMQNFYHDRIQESLELELKRGIHLETGTVDIVRLEVEQRVRKAKADAILAGPELKAPEPPRANLEPDKPLATGFLRDLESRLQTMRKEQPPVKGSGLKYGDGLVTSGPSFHLETGDAP